MNFNFDKMFEIDEVFNTTINATDEQSNLLIELQKDVKFEYNIVSSEMEMSGKIIDSIETFGNRSWDSSKYIAIYTTDGCVAIYIDGKFTPIGKIQYCDQSICNMLSLDAQRLVELRRKLRKIL